MLRVELLSEAQGQGWTLRRRRPTVAVRSAGVPGRG